MPVSDTRLAVRLDDRATSGLRSLTSTYSRFANTVQNSGRQMTGFASNADKAAGSLSNMAKTMDRLVYSASRYFVIYKALGAVGNVWDTLVGGSYEYAKSLETNQIGIAGILKSMVTLNGEQIKWNDAMAMSGKAMKGLQSEALRTAATSKELIETFRALLGPGLSSGMSIDQIVQLSTVGTNAVRSLGLPSNQYVQELRSIITEGIRPASSTLATSLGITNKDIKEAKASAEGLFNFLMKRMQGFSDAVKYTSGTVEGRIARIQEGLQVAGAKGAEALYQSFSSVLEDAANYLIPVPEKLGDKWEINPAFVKTIKDISSTVGEVVKNVGDLGKTIAPIVGGIGGAGLTAISQFADKLQYIAGIMLAKRLSPFATDIANIATNSRNAYEAQTSLGQAIQGISDKLRGREAELQKVTSLQKVYNDEVARTNAILAQQRQLDKPLPKGWSYNQATDMWKSGHFNSLVVELQRLGAEEEKVYEIARRYFQYLKTGTKEGAEHVKQLILEEEREYQAKVRQIEANNNWRTSLQAATDRAAALTSTLGSLSMGVGIFCDLLGQSNEENREFYESAGNAAMQAGMFAMAIGSISSAISGMIPALANGIAWLQRFAAARSLAGLGVVGAVGVGVAAVIKNAYDNYNQTGIASAVDDWTGEEISHDFGHQFGNPKEMRDIDDADSYAILNTPDVGNVGLINPPSGGGGGGGKGGGGAAKANKAEEYAAKMLKIYEDLNKEIANMSDQTTAYDKVMAQAKDKLAGYEKDIVKAQQLGVDVGEVRNKQIEYQLAMEKKAWEAQQDEYLKYMKQDEEAANRIYVMGGTMEQQRAALAERLEIHKAYLEELLAANIENRDRRAQLEQELANTIKQINDNSVYEFKNGWTQALDEIANRQMNFKDQFVSAFDSIEGSLVNLVSGTGSAKDKFKQFCQDVTNTILKSMTQIIIRGLITKAIMAAIGLGGGGGAISIGSVSSSWASSFTGGSIGGFVPSGYSLGGGIGTYASGGNVKAGETAIVGEQGPELVRFGSSGRVYNNTETKSMLGNNPQNIKIELINESGTELKTENANVKFDVDSMIISTVIKGVSNNTMGMRTMLKGLATT